MRDGWIDGFLSGWLALPKPSETENVPANWNSRICSLDAKTKPSQAKPSPSQWNLPSNKSWMHLDQSESHACLPACLPAIERDTLRTHDFDG